MLNISLIGKPHQFYTFTEILGFIQGLGSIYQRQAVAEQALELLKTSNMEFDLIEHYKNEFNAYINQDEEEHQGVALPMWYSELCGFYL